MHITRVDLANPAHQRDLTAMLDHYASSAEGGGKALAPDALARLPQVLAECPTWVGVLAYEGNTAVGLADGFWSVSTFAARRLLNIHDITVHADWRRRGIGARLLAHMETIARDMACCKLTLEVLQGNGAAVMLYEKTGFRFYQLDPAMGDARFMQKWLEQDNAS